MVLELDGGDNKEQAKLMEIARREAKKMGEKENVLAIGVTGSLAAGNARIGSDIDMVVILGKPEKDYSFERKKIEGRYLEIVHISQGLLKKATESCYYKFPPGPWDVYPCKILYDPHGILKNFSEKTGEIWNSTEYYEREIKKKVAKQVQDAEKALEKAKEAFQQGDYVRAIGTSRGALKGIAGAITEATRTPLSPGRGASRFEDLMLKYGRKDIARQFFSALDMANLDEEEAKKRLDKLEQLLSISRKFLLENPKFKEYLSKHPSRIDYLDSWVNPMFEAGHYLDLAGCIQHAAGLVRFLLEEIGIEEWPPKQPEGFARLYLKCNNLDKADRYLAESVLEESVLVASKLKELIQTILDNKGRTAS